MNNLPKVVTQQRRGRASNPRLLDRKSDDLPLSHRATRNDLEQPQNQLSRSGHSLTLNISEIAKDTAIVTMEGE